LVRLETEDGLVGWGEAFSRMADVALKRVIDTRVLPLVLGRDSRQITRIKHDLEFNLHNFGRSGGIMYGISAVDIALWDIAGKRAGQPLCNLLGGPSVAEVEVYASLVRYGTEAKVVAAVERAIAQGYRWIKLHDIAVPVIRAACEAAAGRAGVMLDVNCPWSRAGARHRCRDRRPRPPGSRSRSGRPRTIAVSPPCAPPAGIASPRARTPAACSTSSPCRMPAPSTSPSPTWPRPAASPS
jgi:L-alanine-DL-glutamate epimerase-like enolase superfamily enzyme